MGWIQQLLRLGFGEAVQKGFEAVLLIEFQACAQAIACRYY